jgi:hypothetical protein
MPYGGGTWSDTNGTPVQVCGQGDVGHVRCHAAQWVCLRLRKQLLLCASCDMPAFLQPLVLWSIKGLADPCRMSHIGLLGPDNAAADSQNRHGTCLSTTVFKTCA